MDVGNGALSMPSSSRDLLTDHYAHTETRGFWSDRTGAIAGQLVSTCLGRGTLLSLGATAATSPGAPIKTKPIKIKRCAATKVDSPPSVRQASRSQTFERRSTV